MVINLEKTSIFIFLNYKFTKKKNGLGHTLE